MLNFDDIKDVEIKLREAGKAWGRRANNDQIEFYLDRLGHLNKKRLLLTIEKAVNTLKFYPKISELLEIYEALPSNNEAVDAPYCKWCDSTGLIHARGKRPDKASNIVQDFAFRCRCTFGQSMSDLIPRWDRAKHSETYELCYPQGRGTPVNSDGY